MGLGYFIFFIVIVLGYFSAFSYPFEHRTPDARGTVASILYLTFNKTRPCVRMSVLRIIKRWSQNHSFALKIHSMHLQQNGHTY